MLIVYLCVVQRCSEWKSSGKFSASSAWFGTTKLATAGQRCRLYSVSRYGYHCSSFSNTSSNEKLTARHRIHLIVFDMSTICLFVHDKMLFMGACARSPTYTIHTLACGFVSNGSPIFHTLTRFIRLFIYLFAVDAFLVVKQPGESFTESRHFFIRVLIFITSCCSKKGKGSPYSITERRVPELIPVLGSYPAGES